jgi:major membrane immunogen (membrane-anchored lipoprotein)
MIKQRIGLLVISLFLTTVLLTACSSSDQTGATVLDSNGNPCSTAELAEERSRLDGMGI